jgi:hypothetical protein
MGEPGALVVDKLKTCRHGLLGEPGANAAGVCIGPPDDFMGGMQRSLGSPSLLLNPGLLAR